MGGQPPSAYLLVLYVRAPENVWYGPKPGIGANTKVNDDFTFTITGWASGDPHDAAVPAIGIYLVPAGAQVPNIIGGPTIPTIVTTAAVVGVIAGRGATYSSSGAVQPTPATTPTPVPTTPVTPAGQVNWPPATLGDKVPARGGFINFAGYRWVVKETGGNRVGPGNNMFSSSANVIWVDNWGLHLNVMPPGAGCDPWVSSEAWLDHALGYGTYLTRIVSPVEFVDPDITWSPFFIWDDSGNAGNGWREIDIEFARWGNAGDPTSSQYVLKPLQGGGPPPGWRTRFRTQQLPLWQGSGQGGGGCNNPGQDNFNGMGVSKVTCVVKWFRTYIQWYCVDGLYTMATMPSAPAASLLSSYRYTNQQWISDPGDARVHFNYWLQNGARPRWGRRSHGIIAGFEFTNQDIRFPQFPDNANIAQRFLREEVLTQTGQAGESGRALGVRAVSDMNTATASGFEVIDLSEGSKVSSGDTSQHSVALTMKAAQDASATLMAGGSGAIPQPWDAPGYQQPTSPAARMSVGAIAGTVVGGVVGLASMFAAGYLITRRRGGSAKEGERRDANIYAAVPTSAEAAAAAGGASRLARTAARPSRERGFSGAEGTELNPLKSGDEEEEGESEGERAAGSGKGGRKARAGSARVAPAASSSSSSSR